MVAITVILAAVIGSFVLNLGGSIQQSAPQANFEYDYDSADENVTITHTSGDSVDNSTVSIAESNTSDEGGNDLNRKEITGDITAGDEIAKGTYDPGETIRVVFESEDGETSATLAQSTAP